MTSVMTTLAQLQHSLNHQFRDITLLQAAMTHASSGADTNYERLEFLGDRVLSLVMAELLYNHFPQEAEGDLAKRHAALVQGALLAVIAREINLGDYLILSEAERAAGGAENENMLADGLEALFGALYLDAGLAPCAALIERLWGDRVNKLSAPPQDPKTALQEWAQQRSLPLPLYEVAERTGPDHAPQFTIRVTVQGFAPAQATGPTRRAAEKESARILLAELKKTI